MCVHQVSDSRMSQAAYREKNKEPKDMTKTEQGYQQSDSANEQVIMMSIPTQTMSRNSKKGIKKNRNVNEIIAKRQKNILGKNSAQTMLTLSFEWDPSL